MKFETFSPIIVLVFLLIAGLALPPLLYGESQVPLEVIFLTASVFSVGRLARQGYSWKQIQDAIVKKLSKAIPAILILFSIGLVIGSWVIAGTIPMLVYYGIKIINPSAIYLVAFVVPAIFSTLTGTSWGSAGTIGVVIMGIAQAIDANLAITAGAVVGGAYMGDKISPLSDTTNIAAISAEVDLYAHIRSMMNTTVPSALLASLVYAGLGFAYPAKVNSESMALVQPILQSLSRLFDFHIIYLLPVAVVVLGAILKKPTVPVLVLSSLTGGLLGLLFQGFTLHSVVECLYKGFHLEMAFWADNVPESVGILLNRGGLYHLNEPIVITIMVFIFIGTLEVTDVMSKAVDRLFRFANSRRTTILSALAATAFTNAMTSNQFATSFIIGDAFKEKFDRLKIPRKVLSRSLEDTGTMLENMLPWTTTGVFMAATLGVPVADYFHWQFLSLFNFIVAPTIALLGIGCFYHEVDHEQSQPEKD